MPTFYDSIPEHLHEWALNQHLFYTASAPLSGSHVNISPKGLPAATFSILNPKRAAYIDSTGSGSETIAHVYENGRVTIMFASFDKAPKIVRFFCKGTVIEADTSSFPSLIQQMGKTESLIQGARAVILLDIFKVQQSCGFGVPLFSPSSPPPNRPSTPPDISESDIQTKHLEAAKELTDRATLGDWARKKVESKQLRQYQAKWNASSLDGLPGMRSAMRENGEWIWWSCVRERGRGLVKGQWEGVLFGLMLGLVVEWMLKGLVEMVF